MQHISNFDITKFVGSNTKMANEYVPALHKDIEYKKSISNIPRRYRDAKLIPVTSVQKKLLDQFKKNFYDKKIEDVSDMLITGTVGTGKTHLVVALLNHLIRSNIYCKYVTEHDLLNLFFMKQYKDFHNFKSIPVLVIDEMAKRDLVDWQLIQIEELLSYRYNEKLPTIMITNRNKDGFKSFVGDRIADRMKDNKVIVVNLTGESLRGNNA